MSPDQIPALLRQMVPFIDTVGLTIDEVGPGTATASLTSRREVHNNIGTIHAGALYTVGESATGAVVLGLFGDKLPGAFIALKGATVAHTKAVPGDLVAKAAVDGDARRIRAGYEAEGKADFDVVVHFEVGGVEVAKVRYTWAVRAPRG